MLAHLGTTRNPAAVGGTTGETQPEFTFNALWLEREKEGRNKRRSSRKSAAFSDEWNSSILRLHTHTHTLSLTENSGETLLLAIWLLCNTGCWWNILMEEKAWMETKTDTQSNVKDLTWSTGETLNMNIWSSWSLVHTVGWQEVHTPPGYPNTKASGTDMVNIQHLSMGNHKYRSVWRWPGRPEGKFPRFISPVLLLALLLFTSNKTDIFNVINHKPINGWNVFTFNIVYFSLYCLTVKPGRNEKIPSDIFQVTLKARNQPFVMSQSDHTN